MSFLQKSNNEFLVRGDHKKNLFLPIFILIIVIAVFLLPWTRNLLFSVGSPFWSLKNNISTFFSDNINLLNSKKSLIKENNLLKQQIKSNEKNLALYNVLKNENDDLKNILNRKKDGQNFLLSGVLVKPFLSPYDTLIIDVGSSSGVAVKDKVLAEGNTFIGYVSEVYSNNSKVVLYSSPGEKVNVLIGNDNIEKEAVGFGGGNFKVEMPKESNIKEGDNITIPSISTNIFGVVEKIESKESDAFQDVLFKNPVNILELKWVEVLLSDKK
jgi:cell shape-determining protein MreC